MSLLPWRPSWRADKRTRPVDGRRYRDLDGVVWRVCRVAPMRACLDVARAKQSEHPRVLRYDLEDEALAEATAILVLLEREGAAPSTAEVGELLFSTPTRLTARYRPVP